MTRTLIRSWPYRQQLPEGEEAEARAAKMARFWRQPTATLASLRAIDRAPAHLLTREADSCAGWLPERARIRTRVRS